MSKHTDAIADIVENISGGVKKVVSTKLGRLLVVLIIAAVWTALALWVASGIPGDGGFGEIVAGYMIVVIIGVLITLVIAAIVAVASWIIEG